MKICNLYSQKIFRRVIVELIYCLMYRLIKKEYRPMCLYTASEAIVSHHYNIFISNKRLRTDLKI